MANKLTIIDCVVKLIRFFSEKTVFNLNKDYRDLLGVTGNDCKEDKVLVELGLDELEQNNVIKKSVINKEIVAFLKKPIDNIDQQILLSYQTANNVAEKINFYCNFFKNNRDYCNPVSLKEKDIANLINIISYYENNKSQENDLTKKQ